MNVLQMSISASVLIVAVVIIRALALHKLPKKTFLVMWGVVVCRLLIPFSIQSRFSFNSGFDMVKRMLAERKTVSFPAEMTSILNKTNVPTAGEPIGIGSSAVPVSPIVIIWLVGMCACALFFIVTYIKCRRKFKMSLPVENEFIALWLREHPLRRAVQVRQSDHIKSPLTYGVFRPIVLLPKMTEWMDEAELGYILTHEFVHIRRFDNLAKLLLVLAICVHWFNPIVWVMFVLANRDIEISCDETVVQKFDETVKSVYALMLISMEEKKCRVSPMCSNFSKNAIEERIECIMKIKNVTMLSIIAAIMLVAAATTVFVMPASAMDKTKETAKQYVASTTESGVENDITINQTAISYDDYKSWLEKYKAKIQKDVENGLSQQNADELIERHEKILDNIKNGDQVSIRADATEEDILIVPYSDDFKVSNTDGAIVITEK
jgi:beta-lactamase regulating signal transducer with metallopeptidase domain